MKPPRIIRGSGGGGGKGGGSGGSGRVAQEDPDSLRSKQYARVLDMVSEGEIVGLVNGLKSIYLDNTPIMNADGSYNFTGITVDERTGTQAQAYIPGFPAVESETAVQTQVKNSLPVVRQIANSNVDAARITISLPRLTQQDTSTGDLHGASVQIAIDLQSNGGGFIEQITDTISGKTTSRYQRNYRIELAGSPPWDIRVRRITADATSSAISDQTYWESYTEIIDAKLRYPNSALVGIQVDSSQFQGIPKRGYHIRGIKVRVPSNYNPETRAYTGVWDGTFTLAWTDNPAWCFYDIVTADRYGVGAFVDESQIDKWALYNIGQYCDELVPDGFGGMEPRFTCNLYLQSRADAFKVLANFASIFRGITWWQAGAVTAVCDKPTDPTMLFTAANVVAGSFQYSGSSAKARHTVALITWNDPEDYFKQKIEYVEDQDAIALYGVIQTELVATGCTSRGQAHRIGRWLLYSEKLETETVSFKCGLDGTFLAPGDVIQTQDPARAGKRFGGRIVTAGLTSVKLDAAISFETGKTYTLSAVLPDGSIESRAVTLSLPVTTDTVTVASFTVAPQVGSVWVLAASDLVPESWRVISVSESDPGQLAVTALAHNPAKYAAVEQNLVLEPLQTSTLNAIPATPSGLVLTESLYLTGTEVKARISVGWDHVDYPSWAVSWQRAAGNWESATTQVADFQIDDVTPGIYTVRVAAVNLLGVRGPVAQATIEVFGKLAPPAAVTGFSVIKSSGVAIPSWDLHPDLDVRVGGRIVIRHSPAVTGAVWEDAYIVEQFDGNATAGVCALMTGTYFAKAMDSSGNWSVTATSFVATEGMVTGFTTVASAIEDSAFSGPKTAVVKVGGSITLAGADTIDDRLDPIDSWGLIDSLGGIVASGEYQFSNRIDCGTVAVRRFQADLDMASFDTGETIDMRTASIDTWPSFDGSAINDCDLTIYASTTNDDPAGSPTWGAWTPFFVSDFTCRAARFKAVLSSGSPNHNLTVSRLRVAAKIPA